MPNTDKQPIDHKPPRPQTLDDLFAAYQGDYHPTEIDTGADVGLEQVKYPHKNRPHEVQSPRAGFAVSGIRYPTEPSAASSSIGTITTSTTPLSSSGMSR